MSEPENLEKVHSQRHDSGAIREESPLTLNEMLKWGGILVTIISAAVSFVWYVASIRGEITSIRQEIQNYKETTTFKQQKSEEMIIELKFRVDASDKSLSELSKKLEVAITLLERIDKKVGNP